MPGAEITIDWIATEIGNLGEPELFDTVEADASGTPIAVYRYYLDFSRSKYFLNLRFHKYMGGWTLYGIRSCIELSAVVGVN